MSQQQLILENNAHARAKKEQPSLPLTPKEKILLSFLIEAGQHENANKKPTLDQLSRRLSTSTATYGNDTLNFRSSEDEVKKIVQGLRRKKFNVQQAQSERKKGEVYWLTKDDAQKITDLEALKSAKDHVLLMMGKMEGGTKLYTPELIRGVVQVIKEEQLKKKIDGVVISGGLLPERPAFFGMGPQMQKYFMLGVDQQQSAEKTDVLEETPLHTDSQRGFYKKYVQKKIETLSDAADMMRRELSDFVKAIPDYAYIDYQHSPDDFNNIRHSLQMKLKEITFAERNRDKLAAKLEKTEGDLGSLVVRLGNTQKIAGLIDDVLSGMRSYVFEYSEKPKNREKPKDEQAEDFMNEVEDRIRASRNYSPSLSDSPIIKNILKARTMPQLRAAVKQRADKLKKSLAKQQAKRVRLEHLTVEMHRQIDAFEQYKAKEQIYRFIHVFNSQPAQVEMLWKFEKDRYNDLLYSIFGDVNFHVHSSYIKDIYTDGLHLVLQQNPNFASSSPVVNAIIRAEKQTAVRQHNEFIGKKVPDAWISSQGRGGFQAHIKPKKSENLNNGEQADVPEGTMLIQLPTLYGREKLNELEKRRINLDDVKRGIEGMFASGVVLLETQADGTAKLRYIDETALRSYDQLGQEIAHSKKRTAKSREDIQKLKEQVKELVKNSPVPYKRLPARARSMLKNLEQAESEELLNAFIEAEGAKSLTTMQQKTVKKGRELLQNLVKTYDRISASNRGIENLRKKIKFGDIEFVLLSDFHTGSNNHPGRPTQNDYLNSMMLYLATQKSPTWILGLGDWLHGNLKGRQASQDRMYAPNAIDQDKLLSFISKKVPKDRQGEEVIKHVRQFLYSNPEPHVEQQLRDIKFRVIPTLEHLLSNGSNMILTSGNHYNNTMRGQSDEARILANLFGPKYVPDTTVDIMQKRLSQQYAIKNPEQPHGKVIVFPAPGESSGVGYMQEWTEQRLAAEHHITKEGTKELADGSILFVGHTIGEGRNSVADMAHNSLMAHRNADMIFVGDRHQNFLGFVDGKYMVVNTGIQTYIPFCEPMQLYPGMRGLITVSKKPFLRDFTTTYKLNETLENFYMLSSDPFYVEGLVQKVIEDAKKGVETKLVLPQAQELAEHAHNDNGHAAK